MKPVVNGLEETWKNRVSFLRLDVDTPEGSEAARRLGTSGIPAFYFISRDGRVVGDLMGAVPQADLESRLQALATADTP